MLDTTLKPDAAAPWMPAQWRSSDDLVVWTSWQPVHEVPGSYGPWQEWIQLRILIDGVWHTSDPMPWD